MSGRKRLSPLARELLANREGLEEWESQQQRARENSDAFYYFEGGVGESETSAPVPKRLAYKKRPRAVKLSDYTQGEVLAFCAKWGLCVTRVQRVYGVQTADWAAKGHTDRKLTQHMAFKFEKLLLAVRRTKKRRRSTGFYAAKYRLAVGNDILNALKADKERKSAEKRSRPVKRRVQLEYGAFSDF